MQALEDDIQRLAEARVGRVLRGKYRLDKVLGVGGMAAVYVATHRNRKQFAIKMLHPDLSIRETIRGRFLREGYVANTVNHPGSVAVLDDDVAEDGSAFLVMELLEGATLDALWEKRGNRMPAEMVLAIAHGLLDVLSAASEKGIVHRDLKPQNLFLTRDGSVKVLDFGIARLRDATSGTSTQTGALLGTPAYMAPEQAIGKASEVDAQTDLWAVGATMFTLISGQLVHAGENAQQQMIAAATQAARSLATVAPGTPDPVVYVVDKALAFSKADRWRTASEMRAAVHEAHVRAFGAPIVTPAQRSTGNLLANEVGRASGSDGAHLALEPTWEATKAPEPTAKTPGSAGSHGWKASDGGLPARGVSTTGAVESARVATSPRARSWVLPVAATVVLAGAGVGAALKLSHGGMAVVAPASGVMMTALPSTGLTASVAAEPPPLARLDPSVRAPDAGETAAASTLAPPATPSPPSRPPAARTATPATPSKPPAPAPPAQKAPAPKATTSCDPPFTTDSDGVRHPKPECL